MSQLSACPKIHLAAGGRTSRLRTDISGEAHPDDRLSLDESTLDSGRCHENDALQHSDMMA